jgi:hypothetical protein
MNDNDLMKIVEIKFVEKMGVNGKNMCERVNLPINSIFKKFLSKNNIF